MTKSSTSIWHLLHNVKSMVKISSIFVAFLENMNFKHKDGILDLWKWDNWTLNLEQVLSNVGFAKQDKLKAEGQNINRQHQHRWLQVWTKRNLSSEFEFLNWNSNLDWTLLDVCFVKQDKLKLKGKMSTDNVDADGFKFEQKENCLLNDDYSLPFDTHCGN